MKNRLYLPWSLSICLIFLASESFAAKATTLILGKSKPEPKIDILPTGEEEIPTSPGSSNVTIESVSNSTNATKLTGVPQIDYIYDPNLPRELNGYNLTDYPFYNAIPEEIDFKCDGLHDGFYASVPHKCQVYHHCLFGTRYDFLCANYTAFDQKTFICHFASEVDCKNSPKYYNRNEALYKAATTSTAAPAPSISSTGRRAQAEKQTESQSSGTRRKRPYRRRRPMYEYYDDYEDYQAEPEYYDDIPAGYRRRKRPRPHNRDSYGEAEEYEDEEKLPPSAPSKSVYDRPRVAPKIRRPVPINERDKYDYSADARVVATKETATEKTRHDEDSNGKNQQSNYRSPDYYESTGSGGSRNRGSDSTSRSGEREATKGREHERDRPLRDRRPYKKRRRPESVATATPHSFVSDYDDDVEEEVRRPRPSNRDRPRYDDYEYDDRPLRNPHRPRENSEYRSRDTQDYDRDRYYDRPRNRDSDYDRSRNREQSERHKNRDDNDDDDDERPTRTRHDDDRPSRNRDDDERPNRNRETDYEERPSRNRESDERLNRNRDNSNDDRSNRNRDDDQRPSRTRNEDDRPIRNRDEDDRPIRNRDEDHRPSRNRENGDKPSRIRNEDDNDDDDDNKRNRDWEDDDRRNKNRDEERPSRNREKDEKGSRNNDRDDYRNEKPFRNHKYEEEESGEVDTGDDTQTNEKDTSLKKQNEKHQEDNTKLGSKGPERPSRPRDNTSIKKDQDKNDSNFGNSSEEERSGVERTEGKNGRHGQRNSQRPKKQEEDKTYSNTNYRNKEQNKERTTSRPSHIQRMRVTIPPQTEDDPYSPLNVKPVPAPRPAYITKPERKNIFDPATRKLPNLKRPTVTEDENKSTLTNIENKGQTEKEEVELESDYYDEESEEKDRVKLDEHNKDYGSADNEKTTSRESKKEPVSNIKRPRPFSLETSKEKTPETKLLTSKETKEDDEKTSDTKLKVPFEESSEGDDELAPKAPKFAQPILRRRPFLPSRGGNPNLPRGLMPVGIKSLRNIENRKPNNEEKRVTDLKTVQDKNEDPPVTKQTDDNYHRKNPAYNPYHTASGIEFRTKVTASLGVEQPRLANPILYKSPAKFKRPPAEEIFDSESHPDLAGPSEADTEYSQDPITSEEKSPPNNDNSRQKDHFTYSRPNIPEQDFIPDELSKVPETQSEDTQIQENIQEFHEEEKTDTKPVFKGTTINFRPTLKTTHFSSLIDVDQTQPDSSYVDDQMMKTSSPVIAKEAPGRNPSSSIPGHYITKTPFIFLSHRPKPQLTNSNQKLGPQTFYSENPKFRTTLPVAETPPKVATSNINYNTGTHIPSFLTSGLRQISVNSNINKNTPTIENRSRTGAEDYRFSSGVENPTSQQSDFRFPGDNLADTDEYDVSLNDALQPLSTLHPRNVQTGIHLSNSQRNIPVQSTKRKFQQHKIVPGLSQHATIDTSPNIEVHRHEYLIRNGGVNRAGNIEQGHKLLSQRQASSTLHERYIVPPFYNFNQQSRPTNNPSNFYGIFVNK